MIREEKTKEKRKTSIQKTIGLNTQKESRNQKKKNTLFSLGTDQ